jgi:two-component system cell cycle response regulator DivK
MKKVLVVEDVDMNRELMVQLLEDNYEVIEAVNGLEGVEAAKRERPELILMDLSLPVMNGWEATRRLKADPELKSIPVIALTAHAMKGDRETALAVGCDDYLVKPLDEDELMEKMAKYLG